MRDTSLNADDFLQLLAERIADAVVQRLQASDPEATSADELIDEPAMAKRLGISQPTLQRRRAAGEVPCIRLGRRVLYRPAEVFEALSRQGDAA